MLSDEGVARVTGSVEPRSSADAWFWGDDRGWFWAALRPGADLPWRFGPFESFRGCLADYFGRVPLAAVEPDDGDDDKD